MRKDKVECPPGRSPSCSQTYSQLGKTITGLGKVSVVMLEITDVREAVLLSL